MMTNETIFALHSVFELALVDTFEDVKVPYRKNEVYFSYYGILPWVIRKITPFPETGSYTHYYVKQSIEFFNWRLNFQISATRNK